MYEHEICLQTALSDTSEIIAFDAANHHDDAIRQEILLKRISQMKTF